MLIDLFLEISISGTLEDMQKVIAYLENLEQKRSRYQLKLTEKSG